MGLNTLVGRDEPANDATPAIVPPSKEETETLNEIEKLRARRKSLNDRRGAISIREGANATRRAEIAARSADGDVGDGAELASLRDEAAKLSQEQGEITAALHANVRELVEAEQSVALAARQRICMEQQLRLDRRLMLARRIDALLKDLVVYYREMAELGERAHFHVMKHVKPIPSTYSIECVIRPDKFKERIVGAIADAGLPIGDAHPNPRTLEARELVVHRWAALTDDLQIVAYVDDPLQPPPSRAA